MIKVTDKITLMMLLDNDKEWPLERFVFKSLQISQNVMLHVPQAHLVFSDRESVLQKFPLGDSQTLRIVIKVAGDSSPAYDIKMRVFKLSKTSAANIDYYNLYMIYDAPRFIYENYTGSINASSVDALDEIVGRCGLFLEYNTLANTPDKQIWIPRGAKFCSFARNIVAAGYASDTSCMQMAVDIAGRLVYRNLSLPWYGVTKQKPYVFSSVSWISCSAIIHLEFYGKY